MVFLLHVIKIAVLLMTITLYPSICESLEFFHFPLSVGNSWTYRVVETVETFEEEGAAVDTTRNELVEVKIIEKIRIGSEEYHEISEGGQAAGLFRVSAEGSVWQYDPDTQQEALAWDIWREPVDEAWREKESVSERFAAYEGLVVPGEGPLPIARWGPFALFEEHLISQIYSSVDTTLLPEEEIVFIFHIHLPEGGAEFVIAPSLGVISYSTAVMTFPGVRRTDWALVNFDLRTGPTAVKASTFGALKRRVKEQL